MGKEEENSVEIDGKGCKRNGLEVKREEMPGARKGGELWKYKIILRVFKDKESMRSASSWRWMGSWEWPSERAGHYKAQNFAT